MPDTWDIEDAQNARNLAYTPAHGWEQYKAERNAGRHPLMSYSTAQYDAYLAGVRWAKDTMRAWDGLDTVDAVNELRLGRGSIFHPVFANDPRFWPECPRCDMRTLTTVNGCTECGHDHQPLKGSRP